MQGFKKVDPRQGSMKDLNFDPSRESGYCTHRC